MVFPVVMCGCESWTVKKAECICLTSVDTLLWMTMFYTNFYIFQPNVLSFCPGSYPGPASTQSYISQASSALWEFLRLSLILMLTILSNSGQEFCIVFSSWLGWRRGSLGRRCRGGESFIPHPAEVTLVVSVSLTVERSCVSCEPLGRQPCWADRPEPWGQALAPETRDCVNSMESFCLGGASLLCGFLIQPLALLCTGCRRWCWSADPALLRFLSWSQGSLCPWPLQLFLLPLAHPVAGLWFWARPYFVTLQAIPGPLAWVLPEFWDELCLGQRRFFWLDHIGTPDLGTRCIPDSRPTQLTTVRLLCSVLGWGGRAGGRFCVGAMVWWYVELWTSVQPMESSQHRWIRTEIVTNVYTHGSLLRQLTPVQSLITSAPNNSRSWGFHGAKCETSGHEGDIAMFAAGRGTGRWPRPGPRHSTAPMEPGASSAGSCPCTGVCFLRNSTVSQAASLLPRVLTSLRPPEQMRCLHAYTGRSPSALASPRVLCWVRPLTCQLLSRCSVPCLHPHKALSVACTCPGSTGPSLQRVMCKVRCEWLRDECVHSGALVRRGPRWGHGQSGGRRAQVRRRLRGGPTGCKAAVESGSPSSINEDGFEQGKQGAFLKGPGWEGGAGRNLSSRWYRGWGRPQRRDQPGVRVMDGEMVRGVSGCAPEQKPIGTSRDLAEGGVREASVVLRGGGEPFPSMD